MTIDEIHKIIPTLPKPENTDGWVPWDFHGGHGDLEVEIGWPKRIVHYPPLPPAIVSHFTYRNVREYVRLDVRDLEQFTGDALISLAKTKLHIASLVIQEYKEKDETLR